MAAIITQRDSAVNTFRVRPVPPAVQPFGMSFAERLRSARLAAQLTQEQLAHACGFTGQSRIANYESGSRSPSLSEIPLIAQALKVSSAFLLGDEVGTPSDTDWSDIIGVRQAAALGDGAVADEYAETHKLKFRADSLRRKKLRPDKLAVIYGKGDSMYPTIKDGDAILVDTSDRTPRDGKLYVITYNGDLMAKRLVELGGRWFIESDNRTDPKWHKPQPLDGTKGIEIHGRVRWIGSWED